MTMEEFATCFGIIAGLIIALLPIVLFFKVWGMCNDVREIKETLNSKKDR